MKRKARPMTAAVADLPAVPVPIPLSIVSLTNLAEKRADIVQEVLSNPYRLTNIEETALCVGRNEKFVRAARRAGVPFPGGVSRPEWLLAWLQANPIFDLKAGSGKQVTC
jgi:hypothetical protein